MITTYLGLKEVDNDKILNYCKELVPIHRTKYFTKLQAQTAGFATWKTDTKPPALLTIIDIVEQKLTDLSGIYKPLSWWFVGLPQYASIDMHDHIKSDWSAVYYPTDSIGSGRLVFKTGEIIEPCAGMLVCFPGDYVHGVTRWEGEGERVSLVFNRVM